VPSGETIIYKKDGLVDSLKFQGPVAQENIELNFTGYTKARITFRYKASADSIYYDISKNSFGWGFPKYNNNTHSSYVNYDSTFSISGFPNGTYNKWLSIFGDSVVFVVRDLKIYGGN